MSTYCLLSVVFFVFLLLSADDVIFREKKTFRKQKRFSDSECELLSIISAIRASMNLLGHKFSLVQHKLDLNSYLYSMFQVSFVKVKRNVLLSNESVEIVL